MHCMRTKYLISNLNSKGTSIGKLAVFAIVGMMLSSELLSAISNNEYVTVESTTPGVEEIYAVLDDFYITTRGVGSPPFAADIEVTANSPWYLKRPRSGHLHLAIGENDIYQVGDGSSSEEGPGGRIYVLKLDIEQQETNVCWKSTSCKLNLTDDSRPGGEAVWSSVPAGISGNGKSVTFNPSSLGPGEYTVTAKSGIVPGYFDTCVVRVIKLVTQTLSNVPSNQDRTKLGIAEDVICHIKPSFNAEWSVEGSGRVRTTSGSMNLFVADKTPGAAVLHAMVLGIDCSVQFEIVQPNGMRVSLFEDLSLGAPGDSQVGAGSIFDCVVLPDDVSFVYGGAVTEDALIYVEATKKATAIYRYDRISETTTSTERGTRFFGKENFVFSFLSVDDEGKIYCTDANTVFIMNSDLSLASSFDFLYFFSGNERKNNSMA